MKHSKIFISLSVCFLIIYYIFTFVICNFIGMLVSFCISSAMFLLSYYIQNYDKINKWYYGCGMFVFVISTAIVQGLTDYSNVTLWQFGIFAVLSLVLSALVLIRYFIKKKSNETKINE